MNDTSISWTHGYQDRRGRTWNPTDGCEVCSPGCANCYAMRMAGRFSGKGKPYEGLVTIGKNRRAIWNGTAREVVKRLTLPLRWRAPSLVFVDSMSDLYYEGFSFEYIAAVYGVMALAHLHVFQVLTKRAKRRREWFAWVADKAAELRVTPAWYCNLMAYSMADDRGKSDISGARFAMHQRSDKLAAWPLPNVWEGATVESQDVDHRVVDLIDTPATIRFLSCEPLIGPLNLRSVKGHGATMRIDGLSGIHWVIAGVESGPGARPCDVKWLRRLRDQCRHAGTPFFLKQAIESWELEVGPEDNDERQVVAAGAGSHMKAGGVIELPYLDGVQHKEYPRAA